MTTPIPSLAPSPREKAQQDANRSSAAGHFDIGNSSGSIFWEFLRHQPVKYFYGFAGVVLTVAAGIAAAGYQVGVAVTDLRHSGELTRINGDANAKINALQSESTGRIASVTSELQRQITDLRIANTALQGQLSAADAANRALREAVGSRNSEIALSKNQISSLQSTISERNKRLIEAQNCENVRAEAESILTRIPQSAVGVGIDGVPRVFPNHEAEVLRQKLDLLKTRLAACDKAS